MFKSIISAVKATGSILALVLAFTLNASAQDAKPGKAEKVSNRMKTELSLNDDQYTKVLEINKAFEDKSNEVKKTSTDKDANSKAIKALNKDREDELQKVLTKEQFKTYSDKKKAKHAAKKASINGQAVPKNAAEPTGAMTKPASNNLKIAPDTKQ